MTYYDIKRVSNSDLTRLKYQLMGMEYRFSEKAYSFGSVLHEMLLEPGSFGGIPSTVDHKLINTLFDQVAADKTCRWYLQYSRKEAVQFFEDSDTGLPCKAKLDMVYRNHTILDFKTTSCRNYAEFVRRCQEYDYDRQAAFYLDAVGAKRFIFVGIQKVKPFNLFHFEATAHPGFVEYGRRKYKFLLRKWKENQLPNAYDASAISGIYPKMKSQRLTAIG